MPKIEVSDEAFENIVLGYLRSTAETTAETAMDLIRQGSPKDFEIEDIHNAITDLNALNRVIEMFGGDPVDLR